MTQVIVAMQVNAEEVVVLGMAYTFETALELVREDAGLYNSLTGDQIEHIERMARVALADAALAGDMEHGNYDIRFDSGVGSWDYQLVQREVRA